MQSTFLPKDVTILLKDITGMVEPLPSQTREALIQGGVHYSEMLPLEYKPKEAYLQEYRFALSNFSKITASAVKSVARKIYRAKGENVVLISLARSGTPIGILIKRYLDKKYRVTVPHYTVSIIRGRGIDRTAMGYILSRHKTESLQFVDGWTGKGAIFTELKQAMSSYPGVDCSLAVLSDPAGVATIFGTNEDFLIASSCLNSTVCGLMSRTFYRADIIGQDDFHGAAFYSELRELDRTYEFINKIESEFDYSDEDVNSVQLAINGYGGAVEAENIAREFGVKNINFVKPGIGETTRVLLRRTPGFVLIRENSEKYVSHIVSLAEDKNVDIVHYPLKNYRACGIIRDLSDV